MVSILVTAQVEDSKEWEDGFRTHRDQSQRAGRGSGPRRSGKRRHECCAERHVSSPRSRA